MPELCSPEAAREHACDPRLPSELASTRGILTLAHLLRGKRLLFIGDSMTNQITQALLCAARRNLPGGVEPRDAVADLSHVVPECDRLEAQHQHASMGQRSPARMQERRASAFALAHLGWMCSQGDVRRPRLLDRRGRLRLDGFHAPAFNLTWYPIVGRQMNFVATPSLVSWTGENVSRWPSRLELVSEQDLADVVVFGVGLHYRSKPSLSDGLRVALRQLQGFARRRHGRAAIIRQISAQHFNSDGGSYLTAKAQSDSLVKLVNGSTPTTEPCKPLGGDSSSWYNTVMRRALDETVGEVAHALLVRLQPFEELTKPRWDFHIGTKTSDTVRRGVREVVFDCTHFCYSPSFWDASLYQLYTTLSGALR